MNKKIVKSEAEWLDQLGPDRFAICRTAATERPFSGAYCNTEDAGIYECAACGTALFSSEGKFHSGCGWPSFFQPINDRCITEKPDHSHGMTRIEILCACCDSHLGHVFPDGPPPTGLRYCVNSLSLAFKPAKG